MVVSWDPEMIEFQKMMGTAPSLPDGYDAKKAMIEGLFVSSQAHLPPAPEGIVTKDFDIPDGPAVRVYRPASHADSSSLPLIVFCHGGGFFCGNLETEDRTCRMVCGMTPAWVVSVDYRATIDTPLEDEVEDCYKAFEWARGRAGAHGADPNRVAIWGGSAGGALAAAVVHRLVQEGKGNEVAGLICMNPIFLHPDATPEKYKHLMTSYVDNAGDLPLVSGHDTYGIYRDRNIEPPNTDINIFPAAGGADAVRGFPPTYLISSDNDASRDDSTVLEAELKDAGVPVKRVNIMGLAHYFWTFPLAKANENFWSKLTSGISWAFEQGRDKVASGVNGHSG